MTVSAYIIRTDDGDPKLLVHMHKKLGKLMQIGGHIEFEETPWQALLHEISEESGYTFDDLSVLQPTATPFVIDHAIVHPVPLLVNTHYVPYAAHSHYHSDLVYGFTTDHIPAHLPADGESTDLRWLSLSELKTAAAEGIALQDVADIFATIVDNYLNTYVPVTANSFSLEKPTA